MNRLAGYDFLIARHELDVAPNWRSLFVSSTTASIADVQVEKNVDASTVYSKSYWPGDGTGDHLGFALRYDGVNLGILAALFEAAPEVELAAWIAASPTGKYRRKAWFLYEFLTGRKLPLSDLGQGNYVELLEPERYFIVSPGQRVKRQRIVNNLLGSRDFCPLVRRTSKIASMDDAKIQYLCGSIADSTSPELLNRALAYLYAEETKSSFWIEGEKPDSSRTARFIRLMRSAENRDFCVKPLLIEAQNQIVEKRFRNANYRDVQVYVGQTTRNWGEDIHYVCPKPEDVPKLMEGLLAAHAIMGKGGIPAVVHAAVASYGLVFLHPFEDGNGRLHRFLIHNVLSTREAIPKGFIIPVSAAMLKSRWLYAQSLEQFSTRLRPLVKYQLDAAGRMDVEGDTARLYKYIDFTAQAEALCDFIELSVSNELRGELDYLEKYEWTKAAMQEIVDMPDHLVNNFIKLCRLNGGRLSTNKRRKLFDFLTDGELGALESAVRKGFLIT